MIKKSNVRRTITISESLSKLIDLRGGNDYIIDCLKEIILCDDTPSTYEIEQSTGYNIYEQIAVHEDGYNWYDILFPEKWKHNKRK